MGWDRGAKMDETMDETEESLKSRSFAEAKVLCEEIGKKLKFFREDEGLTIENASNLSGMNRGSFSKIERGCQSAFNGQTRKGGVTITTLVFLANFYRKKLKIEFVDPD